MSIDDVIDAAHAYSYKYHCFRALGKKATTEEWFVVMASIDALRAAIEQHVAEAVAKEREACAAMQASVCQAVALLNRAPEMARCAEGREARDALRIALERYADHYMDAPVTEIERDAVARNARKRRARADHIADAGEMVGQEAPR